MVVEGLTVTVTIDASELEYDLERIESGELVPPTVSAVMIKIDGKVKEEVPVWLEA